MHNFKKRILVIITLAVFVCLNLFLNYALYPYNYTRVDIHNLETADYEQLIIGTSHGKSGIDPSILTEETGYKTINECKGGEYPNDAYYLVKEASRTHEVKRIIYEVDLAYWEVTPNQSAEYMELYYELPLSTVKLEYFLNTIIDADFRTWATPWYFYRKLVRSIPDTIALKNSEDYKNYKVIDGFSSESQTYRSDGFIEIHHTDADKQSEDEPILWTGNPREKALNAVNNMVSFCQKNGIELVFVTTPIPDVTYQKYKENYDSAISYLTNYCKENNLTYLNYLNDSDLSSLDYFSDYDGHMYAESAINFTETLSQDLKEQAN